VKQSDLDLEMQRLGVERQQRRVREAKAKRRESWTSYGQRLISGAVRPTGLLLIAESEKALSGRPTLQAATYRSFLDSVDPFVAAFIAVQTCFDSISQSQKASATFIAVGKQLEWEIVARSWSKKHPYLLKRIKRNFFDKDSAHHHLTKRRSRQDIIESTLDLVGGFKRIWSDAEALRVGHMMVELIRKATGLVDLVTLRTKARNTDTYVIPTPETEAYIRRVMARTEALDPVYMPMVVPPFDWKDPENGGYNLPGVGQPLIKTDRANVAEHMTRDRMPAVYDAINYLQGVPYRINQRVLAVYQWAWENSIPIGDLPLTKDLELPAVPEMKDGETHESESRRAAMRDWWLIANPLKKKNLEAKSRRIHYARLKYLGEKFANQNIFFPMNCDFRGRFYTQPTFLSYQGCDAAKGLLQFGFGKRIETEASRRWLKIQGANSFGVKGTFDARVAWVDKHANQILEAARKPIDTTWWRTADEPWQFLAFCFEVEAVVRDPQHVSHLICWQDGSNNGLQVLSLAFRDSIGGQATNCVPSDEPHDIYQDVADRVLEMLGEESDEKYVAWAKQWIEFGIDRSATKRPVMIVPYSGTIYSSVKYVKTWFNEAVGPQRPSPWPDATKPIGYLTRIIWKAIGEVVVKAREAMDWLRAVAEACIEAGVDPAWTSPTGFYVTHHYPDYEKCTVRSVCLNKTRMWQIREETSRQNRRKHLDALSPNWVHSLDSCGLVLTTNRVRSRGVETMASVHDSVGVLAADGDLLAEETRLGWTELFSTDVVGGLKREIEARINEKLPEPPAFGTLDLNALKGSSYFFA
jgi:DNA-directed RNA polymerase, mitochondrial